MKLKKIKIIGLIFMLSPLLVACGVSKNKDTVVEGDPHKVLANKNARQAMHMALNREELDDYHENISISEGILSRGLFINSNGIDYRDFSDEVKLVYDTDKAQEKWDEAKKELGFTNVTIEMSFIGEGSGLVKEIESQLEKLDGLNIEPVNKDMIDFSDMNNQIIFMSLDAGAPIVDGVLNSFRGDVGIMSAYNYNTDEINNLLDTAGKSTTLDEKWKYCFDAERSIAEEAIVYPLYQAKRERLKKNYVEGNELFTFGVFSSYRNSYLTNGSKTIRIGRLAQPSVVGDIALASNYAPCDLIYETMDGLVRLNEENQIEKVLAESWEVSNDGKVWTFNLVKDAKWHNGDPVVAGDFVYGWTRMLNPEIKSPLAGFLFDIKGALKYNSGEETDESTLGIKAIDDYTLQVELEQPIHEFLSILASPVCYPQNQKFIEKCGDKYGTSIDTMLFNGPFKVEKIDDEKLNYTLVKYNDYRKAEEIKIDKMVVETYMDSTVQLDKFKNNELDVIIDSTTEEYAQYKNSEEFKRDCILETRISGRLNALLFNPSGNVNEEKIEE